jgi:hypothetical protein
MDDPLVDLINDIQNNGIRWGIIFTLYAVYRKESRNSRLDKRDADIFHNQLILMKSLGVDNQWRGQVIPFQSQEVENLKRLLQSSQTVLNRVHQQRRNLTMLTILKSSISKKLLAFLVAAGVSTLNGKLGLDLNPDTIYGIIGVAIAYIIGQSHVDGKKAISNAVNNAATAVIESAATTDGSAITTITAPPMTYEETMKMISQVHTDINRIFADAKNKDDAAAMQTALNAYMTIHDYFAKSEVNP